MEWARENGCPWSKPTCAARHGHLEVLKFCAREVFARGTSSKLFGCRCGRQPGGVEMGARAKPRLPVEHVDLNIRRSWRTPGEC